MKRWSTVQDFIANGKLPPNETVAAFEGFASKGDGGASLWLVTGATGAPSQSPIQRGDNLLTDTTGAVFKPQLGSVFYFDGTNQWFPSPFGDNGNGLYQYNGAGWNYYEQAGGAVPIAVTTGLITNSFNYDVGTALSFTGYSSPGDGGAGQWIKTSSTGSQSQSPALRGDGTLTDATGAVWEIVTNGVIDISQLGASTSNADNSAFLAAGIATGLEVRVSGAYTYDFEGGSITFTGENLNVDFGSEIQTLKNFGGIFAANALSVSFNGRVDCDNTRIVNMVKCFNARALTSKYFEIKNIRNVSPVTAEQTFLFEISNGTVDKEFVANFGNLKVVNAITETQDYPNATPMTLLGGYGSSSTHTKQHIINIDNLHVEEFYTLDESDSATLIGGDSDVFRLFTNPTQLNINNAYIKNAGKRFIKTQEQVNCTVNNVYTELDARFNTSNYNGTFEGQGANSGNPTVFNLGKVEIQYANAVDTPTFFNASGLEHEMHIDALSGLNFGFFINAVNGVLDIRSAKNMNGFKGGASVSTNVFINKALISNFETLGSASVTIRDSELSLLDTYTSGNFPIDGAYLYNVSLSNWNVDVRCARIKECDGLTIAYERGTLPRRPLRPSGIHSIMKGVRVIQNGGDAVDAAIESDGGTGDLIVRDFRSATVGCGFISTGSYDVVLDNCDGTITGAGVNSLLTATYA